MVALSAVAVQTCRGTAGPAVSPGSHSLGAGAARGGVGFVPPMGVPRAAPVPAPAWARWSQSPKPRSCRELGAPAELAQPCPKAAGQSSGRRARILWVGTGLCQSQIPGGSCRAPCSTTAHRTLQEQLQGPADTQGLRMSNLEQELICIRLLIKNGWIHLMRIRFLVLGAVAETSLLSSGLLFPPCATPLFLSTEHTLVWLSHPNSLLFIPLQADSLKAFNKERKQLGESSSLVILGPRLHGNSLSQLL